jgi:hypothetical protein
MPVVPVGPHFHGPGSVRLRHQYPLERRLIGGSTQRGRVTRPRARKSGARHRARADRFRQRKERARQDRHSEDVVDRIAVIVPRSSLIIT